MSVAPSPSVTSPPAAVLGGGLPTPPSGTGGATQPQPQLGSAAQALPQVLNAVRALQSAVGNLPMGSDLHMAVLKAISEISKHIKSDDVAPGAQSMALMNQARQQQQQQSQAALARILAAKQAASAPPVPPAPSEDKEAA